MDYHEYLKKVLEEHQSVLPVVSGQEVEALIESLLSAKRVFAVGVGRVQLSLLAFVKRLNHLGIAATYVGAIDEPAITKEDLLLVGSGSGETAIPAAIARIAKKHGAKIAHVGSNTRGTISKLADITVRIPCRTKLALADEIDSIQPMSSLFEQCLLIFLDVAALMLVERKKIDINTLWQTHANLE